MAKLNDILELQKSGFTADEIAKLLPLIEEEKPAVEVKPVEVVQPVKAEEKITESEKVTDKLDELIQKLELNGILNSQQPVQETESVEDIMANIINPK